MICFAPAALAVVLGAASAAVVPPSPSAVPPVGAAVRYHVVRTTQEASGAKTAVSDVVLRRKAQTTATLEGTIAGKPADLTVLDVGRDGTLYIPKNDKVAAADAVLVDVVSGLNRLSELFAGENGAPRDGWVANLSLPEGRATAAVVLPVLVSNVSGGDFTLRADGEYAPAQPAPGSTPQRGGRRGGFRRGGGPPDDGAGGGPGDGGAFGAPVRLPFGVAVSVEGSVRRGLPAKVTITETRTVSAEAITFTNVSGWTIEAIR